MHRPGPASAVSSGLRRRRGLEDEEHVGGEEHEVHDALQVVGLARAEGQHAHDERERHLRDLQVLQACTKATPWPRLE